MAEAFSLHDMRPQDVAAACALSQQVQWPHRLADWRQACALGSGVIARCQGQTVGCASSWRWGDRATLGLVIVAEPQRGQGIARAMMNRLMAPLAGYHLHLVASDQGKPLYRRLGFVECGQLAQHQYAALPARSAQPLPPGLSLRAATTQDLPRLAALDHAASGLQRYPLLDVLLSECEQALVLEQQGITVGFALRRRFGYGQMIGPVVVPELLGAIALIDALAQDCTGQFMRVDTPAESGLSSWLTQRGLPCIDTPTIMVRGMPHRPDTGGVQTFSLVSQALS